MKTRLFIIFALALMLCMAPVAAVSGSQVNINTADAEELISLPGIGPALAERIIEHRADFPFEAKEDIKQVSGIGDARYEEIKNLIAIE